MTSKLAKESSVKGEETSNKSWLEPLEKSMTATMTLKLDLEDAEVASRKVEAATSMNLLENHSNNAFLAIIIKSSLKHLKKSNHFLKKSTNNARNSVEK